VKKGKPTKKARLSDQHREAAAAAYAAENVTKVWTALGLLGLYYSSYHEHFKVDYTLGTSEQNLRAIEILMKAVGGEEMAYWGIRALFSAEMAWVKGKDLAFFTHEKGQRWVLQAATKLRDRSPDWKGSRWQAGGVVSKPKGWDEPSTATSKKPTPAAQPAPPSEPVHALTGKTRKELVELADSMGVEHQGLKPDDIRANLVAAGYGTEGAAVTATEPERNGKPTKPAPLPPLTNRQRYAELRRLGQKGVMQR
jgi:hypothetical protein